MAVPLFERRELPPTRVGLAKPGFDLAEGAELAQAGQTLSKFAGARFDKLINSMAANEFAEFQGIANTEIENFSTFVKSKPGAPFKELEAERNKMIQRLEAISAKAVTEPGRQAIKNWMLQNVTLPDGTTTTNKGLIFAKTQNNMVAIRTRQAFDISESLIKQFETNFNEDGLRAHYEEQIPAGLYNRDVIFGEIDKKTGKRTGGRFAEQLAVMDEAAKELVADNASGIGLAAWEATGNKSDGFAAIQALEGLTADEKALAESKFNVQVNNRRAENQRELIATQTEQIEQISADINAGNYTGLEARIDAMPGLTETQKIDQRDRLRKHIEAEIANKLEDSPYNQSNPAVYGRLLSQIRNEPESITNFEIYEFAGKGAEDGITLGEYNQLSQIHDSKIAALETPGQDPLQHDSVQRAQSSIARVRTFALTGAEDEAKDRGIDIGIVRRQIEAKYQTIQNQLDEFAGKLKIDDPDFGVKIEKETKRLVTPQVEEVTLNWLEKVGLPSRKRRGVFGGRLPGKTEGEQLAEKRLKSLKENAPGIFDSLSKAEIASIRERFRRGATVQEIIELAQ